MTLLKCTFYVLAVGGLAFGGVLDLCQGQPKQGIVALLVAAANAIVFFWR